MEIIPRKEAMKRGLKRWFSGKPCLRGHVGEREGNGNCVECRLSVKKDARAKKRIENAKEVRARDAKYRAANLDKVRESSAKFRERNRERIRKEAAEYRRANPEKNREKAKRGYWMCPDRQLLNRAIARARKGQRANTSGPVTAADALALLDRQGYVCGWCGIDIKEKNEIDHIIAIANGGKHTLDNLVWSCPSCNRRKGTRHPAEFMMELGRIKQLAPIT